MGLEIDIELTSISIERTQDSFEIEVVSGQPVDILVETGYLFQIPADVADPGDLSGIFNSA